MMYKPQWKIDPYRHKFNWFCAPGSHIVEQLLWCIELQSSSQQETALTTLYSVGGGNAYK